MSDHEHAALVRQLRTAGYTEAADALDHLHRQLDKTWVCPCCRQGAEPVKLCTGGEKSGEMVLRRHERALQVMYRQGLMTIIEEAREVFLRGAYQFSEMRIREAFGAFSVKMKAKYVKEES